MSEKLIIKNFGPIQHVELELKKFNVLIGEQATGKSTVAKVLAVCRYFSYILNFDYFEKEGSAFSWGLISWGINEAVKYNTYIHYSCKHYKLEGKAFKLPHDPWIGEDDQNYYDIDIGLQPVSDEFKNLVTSLKNISSDSKIFSLSEVPVTFFQNNVAAVLDNPFYIPTERGLQSIFSLGKQSIPNISDFLYNYFTKIDKILKRFKRLVEIEPLEISYKNENGNGFTVKYDEAQLFSLSNGASGYQSTIPVVLIVKYYTDIIKKKKTFIIEEPELNLFPNAQSNLINYLVDKTVNYNNQILLTTHSPYILTSLNNLIYAYKVGQNNKEEVKPIIEEKYWLNPDEVSAYQLLADGTCEDIFDVEEGLIDAGKIDVISRKLNEQFDALMNIEFAKA